jgi:hypothetical protein
MKRFAIIIGIAWTIVLHCSSGGSMGDIAGGGVIGNPAMPGLSYTDTIHCRVVTKSGGLSDAAGGSLSPFTPLGPDTAHVNQRQRYCLAGTSGDKRFRFAAVDGERISSWSPDSAIEWFWTVAGICSVQVQVAQEPDTTAWSEPLIVHSVE